MERIFEGIMESLCGLIKSKPDQMPKAEYKDYFVVKSKPVGTVITLLVFLAIAITFSVLAFFVDSDTRILFFIFMGLALILSLLVFLTATYQCVVTNRTITKKCLFLHTEYLNLIITAAFWLRLFLEYAIMISMTIIYMSVVE